MQLAVSLALVRLKNGTGGGGGGGTPPVNVTPPIIAGTAPYYVGSTLTGTDGVYSGSPAPTLTRTYQYDIGGGWVDAQTATTHIIQNNEQGTTTAPKARIKEVANNGVGPPVTTFSNELNVFNPITSIPNSLQWLDAADTSTITQVAGAVSQWNDKTSNGNHVTQGTGAQQPITGSRTINGRNAIDFNGTSHRLFSPAGMYNIAMGDNTFASVAAADSLIGVKRLMSAGTSTPPDYGVFYNGAVQFGARNGSSSATMAGVFDAGQHILGFKRSGTSVIPFYDIESAPQLVGSNTSINSMRIGNNSGGNTDYFDGPVAEINFYTRQLTTLETTALFGYYKSKWATP